MGVEVALPQVSCFGELVPQEMQNVHIFRTAGPAFRGRMAFGIVLMMGNREVSYLSQFGLLQQ
jgi:hypothetical protein